MDSVAEDSASVAPEASAALSSSIQMGESKNKTKGEKIYDEVNNIPDIQKLNQMVKK